jgi:hypothetical protein
MSFDLPTTPVPIRAPMSYLYNGVDQTPALGGDSQRLSRVGDRFAMTVVLRKMKYRDSMRWLSARIKAFTDTVVYPVYQKGFTPGRPGTPLVNGASQAGTSLICDGFRANYKGIDGQYFSIIISGKRYLHMLTADFTATSGGAATISFLPMLRATPADNAVLEFALPKMEGFVQGSQADWEPERTRVEGLSFTIVESA